MDEYEKYSKKDGEFMTWIKECANRIYVIEESAVNEFDIEKYMDYLLEKGLRTFEEFKKDKDR